MPAIYKAASKYFQPNTRFLLSWLYTLAMVPTRIDTWFKLY